VTTAQCHSHKVVNAFLTTHSPHTLMSGSTAGDIKWWVDPDDDNNDDNNDDHDTMIIMMIIMTRFCPGPPRATSSGESRTA
jgi:hypothetical protein